MFVVLLTYVKPLEAVDRAMKEHMTFLRAGYRAKIFIASGRRVPRTGGVILARAPSKEELAEVIERDPFVREGIATYEIIEFKTSQHDPDFDPFADT
jgi:uncharacterized protein YciI